MVRDRGQLLTGMAAAAVLAAGLGSILPVRAAEQRAQQVEREQAGRFHDAVVQVFADVEQVLDPVFQADVRIGPVADTIRDDVYRNGGLQDALQVRRQALDRLPPVPKPHQGSLQRLRAHLDAGVQAVISLTRPGATQADHFADVRQLGTIRAAWQGELRRSVLRADEPLPSPRSHPTTVGATRAAAVLALDVACGDRQAQAARILDPTNTEQAVRAVQTLIDLVQQFSSRADQVPFPAADRVQLEYQALGPLRSAAGAAVAVVGRLQDAVRRSDAVAARQALADLDALDSRFNAVDAEFRAYGATVCVNVNGPPAADSATPTPA